MILRVVAERKYLKFPYENPNHPGNILTVINPAFLPITSNIKIVTDGEVEGIFEVKEIIKDGEGLYSVKIYPERRIGGEVGGENDYLEYFPLMPGTGYLCVDGGYSHLTADFFKGGNRLSVENNDCFSVGEIVNVWGYTPNGDIVSFGFRVDEVLAGELVGAVTDISVPADIKFDYDPYNIASLSSGVGNVEVVSPVYSIGYRVCGDTIGAMADDYLQLTLVGLLWADDLLYDGYFGIDTTKGVPLVGGRLLF